MRKILLILAACYATSTFAADPTSVPTAPDLTKLQAVLQGDKPDKVTPSVVPGLFEVVFGGQVLYVSADGRFVVQGDLIDLNSQENITEQRRGALRGEVIAAVNEKDMVVFAPSGEAKYTITVFTDIDCGYCRKMHSQMAEYNKEGIKLRYLMFPREGTGSESFKKSVSVWCADNRQEAMNKAKRGEAVQNKTCENPVQAQYELGQKLGVRGTPSIILENGKMIPGYVPPTQLVEILAASKDKTASAAKP